MFINDLVSELPRGVKAALYVDDLALWCKEEHASTANYRIQQANLTNLQHGLRTGVSLSTWTNPPQPYSPCHQRSKLVPSRLVHTLKEEDQATYLGVTFDKRLTHTLRTEGKARKKLAIMRKLAGTTWGANKQILKTVYEESVRPVLEYRSTAWSTTATTNQQSLDKIQNHALRIITGAMKSTPITFMELPTAIQPLQ